MTNNDSREFKEFLLSEYSNIAEAHFKSIESISAFFRYYLLIMSIPISSVAVISQIGSDVDQLKSIINQYKLPISIILFSVVLIGVGVLCYIINLRLDCILYARAVNGIRKFFYDKFMEDINLKLRWRALPQSPHIPFYFEKSFFLPVVCVFGVMNSLYCFLGLWVFNGRWKGSGVPLIAAVFSIHFILYWWHARHRELSYLKSSKLGIDIDGVINKHREHFCAILKEKTKKEIKPEDILIMPVNEYSHNGVT
ncbi:MAG: hypothetical protein NC831_08955 [Candidatus Omnitrophica bacterium]|nr:hypothetical protein [Candidatus Omnitrophota bacterium]